MRLIMSVATGSDDHNGFLGLVIRNFPSVIDKKTHAFQWLFSRCCWHCSFCSFEYLSQSEEQEFFLQQLFCVQQKNQILFIQYSGPVQDIRWHLVCDDRQFE